MPCSPFYELLRAVRHDELREKKAENGYFQFKGTVMFQKSRLTLIVFIFFSYFSCSLFLVEQANAALYGATLCHSSGYKCVKIKKGDTWEKLAPNAKMRDLLQRINRMNIEPFVGTIIAVPVHPDTMTIYDASPFPRYIDPPNTKTIYVSQKDLAWGAYDADGNLVWWGPVSPGRAFCADIQQKCQTPNGIFYVQGAKGINCVSSQFPIRKDGTKGGAPMPYCVHFWGGYAFHGSTVVPGYAASHGCIRMFIQDAQWLNQHFIELPQPGRLGTRIVISEKTL